MTDQLVVSEAAGTVVVPAVTMAQIVARAAERVSGTRVRRPRRNVEVDVADGSATVSLRVAARYGAVLPELAEAVQREVTEALGRMCELSVRSVDVSVEELVEG